MDDSWQDAALSNRHLHNRTKGRNIGAGGKSKSLFDVRRIFGTYEVKCAAAEKKAKDAASTTAARLEVHGLNDAGNAVYAELILPGVLHANCILAGSRKTLSRVVEGFKKGDADDDEDEDSEDDEDHDEDDLENQRAHEFEKNSFRSPKFWVKWQGRIICSSQKDESSKDKLETDMGYLVFSGNSCDKFEGTLSCEALEWKNTKIKGWSIATKPQRDFAMEWQDT